MVLPILAQRHEGIITMASRSKDGEIIARWLERNGIVAARGSTGKGGRRGLDDMIAGVRAGRPAALTIDGPKGLPASRSPASSTWRARQAPGSCLSRARARGRGS